jgi:hypothetical protein
MPSRSQPQQAKDRGWVESLVWAAVIVAVATAASTLINPLLDRTVHWDIVAVLMPTLFVLFSFLFKKRWV